MAIPFFYILTDYVVPQTKILEKINLNNPKFIAV
jgi:hypothetical protein